MQFKPKNPHQLDPVNGVEIEDDIVRLRWWKNNKTFSRNTLVTIRVKGDKKCSVMLPEFEIMGLVKLKLQILDVMSTKQIQELLNHEFNSVYQSILTTD